MTGPEHYQEAEKNLAILDDVRDPEEWAKALAEGALPLVVAAAQAHATLALAAATATGLDGHPAGDWDAWRKVASGHDAPA